METSDTTSQSSPAAFNMAKLCTICLEAKPIYKCPACSFATCSLACSNRHRARASCSGQRNLTAYAAKAQLKDSIDTLADDYSFLDGVLKSVKPVELEETIEPPRPQALSQALLRSNVEVVKAPRGMKRALENKTALIGSKKHKHISWTIEWILNDDTRWHTENRDDDLLENAYHTSGASASFTVDTETSITDRGMSAVSNDTAIRAPKLCFFVRKYPSPANERRLKWLDGNHTIRANLQGLTVLEYPTIYVFDECHDLESMGFKLVLDMA